MHHGPDAAKTTRLSLPKCFRRRISLPIFILALTIPASLQANPFGWTDPEGNSLPFQTLEEAEAFLVDARVVSQKRVGAGVNNPFKILLEKDGTRAHACFRDVSVSKATARLKGRTHKNFRDDALFEIAAYRLAKVLGLNNIPPVIVRKIDGKKGSLQLWIEDGTTEKARVEQKLIPSDIKRWRHQMQTMRAFDNLIYNDDRNQGNILFDSSWNLWMIDHTRSFRGDRTLYSPNTVRQCDQDLLARLKELDFATVKEAVYPYVRPREIRSLLKRRDLLLEHLDDLIQARGSQVVLFQTRGAAPSALSFVE